MKKEPKLYQIGWALSTSSSDIIEANAEANECEVNWDDVNETIGNFESHYESILAPWVNSCRDEGHDSDDALVGSAWVTKKQIKAIEEGCEFVCENEYVLMSSAGTLNCEELDFLNEFVDANLTFYLYPANLPNNGK